MRSATNRFAISLMPISFRTTSGTFLSTHTYGFRLPGGRWDRGRSSSLRQSRFLVPPQSSDANGHSDGSLPEFSPSMHASLISATTHLPQSSAVSRVVDSHLDEDSTSTSPPEAGISQQVHQASTEHSELERPQKRRRKQEIEPELQNQARSDNPKGPVSSSDRPDWRRLLCLLLETEPNTDDAALVQGIGSVRRILRQIADLNKPNPPPCPPEPIYTVLHRLRCEGPRNLLSELDTEPPFLNPHYGAGWHLKSGNRVTNLDLYLERNQHASFIVFRDYVCCSRKQKVPLDGSIDAQSEKLVILSERLLEILLQVKDATDDGSTLLPELKLGVELERPNIWTYFILEQLESIADVLEPENKKHIDLFLRYFRDERKAEHVELETLLSQRIITPKFIEYLFVPSRLLLQRDDRGPEFVQAVKQVTWPEAEYSWYMQEADNASLEKRPTIICKIKLKFSTSRWNFDANFQKAENDEKVSQTFVGDTPLRIRDFSLYPLDQADRSIVSSLEERGRRFWTCRQRRYVEYSGKDHDGAPHQPGTRFMIDTAAYTQINQPSETRLKDDLGPDAMSQDKPPEGDFILLLPAVLHGFHMQDKKWKSLLVSNVSDVVWDKAVFDTLVLPDDTKDLIMALVTNKIAADQSTDFFQGKGTGLVILFHGPPGTGKTLTAESVAKLANKPLYRVTCGDIGTDAEQVEKYLKRVLWLGKTWDCVVLLDEAEVFLQERALNDIQRNALVSIFLRILEYYDGILVLTSNRVGTFDEGFKSRIQLAIHYEKLTQSSRERVWENFINRLETFKSDDIDVRDLRRHLKDLADFKMNGRQIRNAVTTGRQLAMFKKKPLDFDCMKHVINVSGRFDKYLTAINEGLEDEDLAREDRLR